MVGMETRRVKMESPTRKTSPNPATPEKPRTLQCRAVCQFGKKPAVILSRVPGGFATGTQRRIAGSTWAEAANENTRSPVPTASARFYQRFFTAFRPRLRPRLRPRRNSVQNDGSFLTDTPSQCRQSLTRPRSLLLIPAMPARPPQPPPDLGGVTESGTAPPVRLTNNHVRLSRML